MLKLLARSHSRRLSRRRLPRFRFRYVAYIRTVNHSDHDRYHRLTVQTWQNRSIDYFALIVVEFVKTSEEAACFAG